MDLNISGIKEQFFTAYHYAAQKTGEFSGHAIKVINTGLAYARQDYRIAIAVVAVWNILCFELIFINGSIALKTLSWVMGDDAELKGNARLIHSMLVTTFALSIFVAMNVFMAKAIEPTLNSKTIIAISAGTCLCYNFIRLWRVSDAKSV